MTKMGRAKMSLTNEDTLKTMSGVLGISFYGLCLREISVYVNQKNRVGAKTQL